LLQQPRTIVAPISLLASPPLFMRSMVTAVNKDECLDNLAACSDHETVINGSAMEAFHASYDLSSAVLPRPKPFFAVSPPLEEVASYYLLRQDDDDDDKQAETTQSPPLSDQAMPQLQPEIVSFAGRIASVRRMARGLAFCDVWPPDVPIATAAWSSLSKDDTIDPWPWRNPVDTKAMAVQLIAGQTLCRTTGSDEAIRQLQVGQLLLIRGRTNVGNRDSLRNWITKRSLDVVVQSYQVLTEMPGPSSSSSSTLPRSMAERQGLDPVAPPPPRRGYTPPAPQPLDPNKCLRLTDLYGDHCDSSEDGNHVESPVVLVDDMKSVKRFANDLSRLLLSLKSPKSSQGSPDIDGNGLDTVALVGVDCEWQPSFLLQSPRDPQPVLLLQICLHSLKRTYLFDLQTLLRPMMPPTQSMDKLEREVSSALGALFESKRLIKVGFQVVHDLRQCAASYPHIPTLHYYNSVLESSTLGKKAIRFAGSGDARIATSSLSRLVEQFIGKPLHKQEQCSDWSMRPLTTAQIEYAALDAAVTPIMVDRMIQDLDVRFHWEKPQLGRWENDLSFKKVLTSWRFVFLHTSDYDVQRKLKAKRVVGDPLIVSQSWTTGDVPPRLPALPENGMDGPYTDIWGLVQVPSALVTIRSTRIDDIIDSMIGERVGKSKDKCVEAFLRRPDVMPAGARLDYPQRSGFVEFRDGVALFVNMPSTPGGRFQPRSYPNEWLNDGQVLTWFLRENDWKQGSSDLAKKLISSPNKVVVTLFVRLGSTGAFLCCGRCRVQDPRSAVNGVSNLCGEAIAPDNWTLIKLHLVLLDWSKLRMSSDFQALLNPDVCYATDVYGKRLD
jgi:3'-5' exonuclease